jgi:glucose/arabinose dehydrogenase
MNRSLLSISLAAIIVLATAPTFNIFAGAQEDHDHVDHAAGTAAGGPTVKDENLAVELVEDGLTLPTAMAFLEEDRMLVLEKDNGTVRMVEGGELHPEPMLDVAVANNGERGMLGMAVSRENATTTYVFLYFTESGGGADGDDRQGVPPAGNRLYRYELEGDRLVSPKLLLDLPALPGPRYNGGPVAIGPDGNVYVIIGDVEGHTTKAQNFENGPAADGTSGVLRIGKNGELPEPVIGNGLFGKYYFAYGVRNSFGLAFDPISGALWNTENGPAYGDEINRVDAGFNSGWRDVQGMASPANLTDVVLFNARSHYSNPEFTWEEPVGPTALAFLNSSHLEGYENDIFVGDINNGALYHFDLNENRSALVLEGPLADAVADSPEESEAAVFGTGFGGITDVKAGPDGNLYILSFTEGAIFRVTAKHEEPTPAVVGDDVELTVRSADISGNEITGMFTIIKDHDGSVLEEGFTPLTFGGQKGITYIVTVADFGDRKFANWDNDSTNRERTITVEEDIKITAHYETNSGNRDNCLDGQTLDELIDRFIRGMLDGGKININMLEKAIDRLAEDCEEYDDSRGRHGRNGDDD